MSNFGALVWSYLTFTNVIAWGQWLLVLPILMPTLFRGSYSFWSYRYYFRDSAILLNRVFERLSGYILEFSLLVISTPQSQVPVVRVVGLCVCAPFRWVSGASLVRQSRHSLWPVQLPGSYGQSTRYLRELQLAISNSGAARRRDITTPFKHCARSPE